MMSAALEQTEMVRSAPVRTVAAMSVALEQTDAISTAPVQTLH